MHGRHPETRHLGTLAPAALIIGAALLAGCQKSLFNDRDQRSQYDQYDKARNQYAQPYIVDEYGRKTPNLRGRLAPRN